MGKKARIMLLVVVVVAAVVLVVIRFSKAQDSRAAWISVLGKCASTQLIGKDVLFFGASNEIGPGSVWRKSGDGSIRLRLELADIEPDKTKRDSLVHTNNAVTCQGNTDSNWQLQLGLPFEGAVTALSVDVSADLKRADSVKVNVGGWSVDELKEALFERLVRDNDVLRDEFASPDRVVVENAVKVSGFSADFNFSKSLADALKLRYSGKEVTLQNGARLVSQFTSDTTLTMKSADTFYILAAFGRMSGDAGRVQFASAKEIPKLMNERQEAIMDVQIKAAAKGRIDQAVPLHDLWIKALTISVTDGVVTLKGQVEDREVRSMIEHAATETTGVREVRNEIALKDAGTGG